MRPVEAFREQARGCAVHGSPMYAGLLDRIADDLEAGGPTSTIIAGHEDAPGPSALALRLLGSVHRLVLERRAGELAAYYPSVGGTWGPALAPRRSWPCWSASPRPSASGSTGRPRPTRWAGRPR